MAAHHRVHHHRQSTSTTSWDTTTTTQTAITTTIRGANTTTSSSSQTISTPTAGSQAAGAGLGFAAEDFNEGLSFGESNKERQRIRVLVQAGAQIHQKPGPAETEEVEEVAIRGRAEETAMIIIGMCSLLASIQYTV